MVADGLGAYTDGREASRCTIQAIVDCIWPEIVKNKVFRLEECSALLTKAIQSANEVVHQQNINLHSKPDVDIDVGVSTTVTAMMIVDSVAYIANVGNCRAYIYHRDGKLKQVTTDHSAVTQLIQSGHMISEDQRRLYRGIVTRALHTQPRVEIDLFVEPLRLGNILLLCSDGLWHDLQDSEIESILSHAPFDPPKIAKELIQAALDRDRGGRDNISVIVVALVEQEQGSLTIPKIQLFTQPENIHLPEVVTE